MNLLRVFVLGLIISASTNSRANENQGFVQFLCRGTPNASNVASFAYVFGGYGVL